MPKRIIINWAKTVMKIFSNVPEFSINKKLSEVINHNEFLASSSDQKDKILYNLAEKHFQDNEKKPFDSYFPTIGIKEIFNNKTILDLGCWCGGKAVSNAERWDLAKITGIDINENFIRAAHLFSRKRRNKKINYEFKVAFGEQLPFADETFDGIISYDVFEHVKSVKNTLSECKRILKKNGKVFIVFPSYYTIGESHLDFATKFPFIHWIFPAKVLNQAYYEIIIERGDTAYWYKPSETKEEWMKYDAGIGVNGTTFTSFLKDLKAVGFNQYRILPTPIFSVGAIAIKYPFLKTFSKLLLPFTVIPGLRDLLSHRIVAIITK